MPLPLPPELVVLGLAALLQCLQFLLYAVLGNLQQGTGYALSPRDTPRTLTGVAGRAQRAMNNHFEGLILFTIAVVITVLGDKGSGATANLAWIYLAARVAYVPAYLFGLTPWRTVIWTVGWLATVGILLVTLI